MSCDEDSSEVAAFAGVMAVTEAVSRLEVTFATLPRAASDGTQAARKNRSIDTRLTQK